MTANAMSSSFAPDDDEVVRVVGDGRRERAAPKARAGHEAEADPAGAEVALDDGELDEVAPGIGDGVAVDDERLARRATPSRPGP